VTYQRHIAWIAVVVAILWCGGIFWRANHQKVEPVLSYMVSWPRRFAKRLGPCQAHEIIRTGHRMTEGGDPFLLQLCFVPKMDGGPFLLDDNGKVEPNSQLIRYRYIWQRGDGNFALLDGDDARLGPYFDREVQEFNPSANDVIAIRAAREEGLRAVFIGNMQLLLGGLAGLAISVWLLGRLAEVRS
jgi:hypothetical protein